MSSKRAGTVGDLIGALGDRFPTECAEEWDRVGLVVGEPSTRVTGVLVTLDATAEAVARAVEVGANVLVTHHPPYLEAPERLGRGPGPAGTAEAAIRAVVSVVVMHTNLDRAPEGASALPRALGLREIKPLESAMTPVVLVTTYAPADAVPALRRAMADAGAGRVGLYEGCAFMVDGIGHFEPRAGARPAVLATPAGVSEVRVEMTAPPSKAADVVAAARAAHPYEEPIVLALTGERARGVARLGRLCAWDDSSTVGALASLTARVLGTTCRVWGDAAASAGRIAVTNGSAGSLIGDALRCADTLITGEVRYHDALAASAAGLAIIEAGHDVTEWPLVHVLADAVRQAVEMSVAVSEEPPTYSWRMMKEPDV